MFVFIDVFSFSQSNLRKFDIVIQDKEKKLRCSEVCYHTNGKLITKYLEFNITSANYRNLNKSSLGMTIHNYKGAEISKRNAGRGLTNVKNPDYKPPCLGCPEIIFEKREDTLIMKIPYQTVCYNNIGHTHADWYFFKRYKKYYVKIYYRYYSYEKNDLDTFYSNTIPMYVR